MSYRTATALFVLALSLAALLYFARWILSQIFIVRRCGFCERFMGITPRQPGDYMTPAVVASVCRTCKNIPGIDRIMERKQNDSSQNDEPHAQSNKTKM